MRKFCIALLLLLTATALVFGAYPNEYPLYLGLLGFSKPEIHDLQHGGIVVHSIPDRMPGEFGAIAAEVHDVPVYYFRDYYFYIENFKSLGNFQMIAKFKNTPDMQDLKALRFEDAELAELLACQPKACPVKLSDNEMRRIPKDVNLNNDFDRERLSNVYRQILLERLLSYRQAGTKGLSPYEDGPSSYDLASILKTHLLRFQYLDAYFPMVQQYILEYPNFRDKRVSEFFYWAKERRGNKPVITLRHVFSLRIGEDYIVVNKLIYANHYFLSSIGIIHLINDSDQGPPRTLTVYEERTLTDLRGDVFEALGRNILRSNLEKSVVAGFKNVGKTIESRYVSASYDDFPFGLQPRDQR